MGEGSGESVEGIGGERLRGREEWVLAGKGCREEQGREGLRRGADGSGHLINLPGSSVAMASYHSA